MRMCLLLRVSRRLSNPYNPRLLQYCRHYGESQCNWVPDPRKRCVEVANRAKTSPGLFYLIHSSSGSRPIHQLRFIDRKQPSSYFLSVAGSFKGFAFLASSPESNSPPVEPKNLLSIREEKIPHLGRQSGCYRSGVGVGVVGFILLAAALVVWMENEQHEWPFSKLDIEEIARPLVSALQDSATKLSEILVSTVSSVCKQILETAWEIMDAGATAVVLFRCLLSVLQSAGEGAANAWPWRPRVAALVADLCAAGGNRRRAVVQAGNGAVVDWLLEVVGRRRQVACKVTQAEAARGLSYLLADEATCEAVLARPHAVCYLLGFASSLQPTPNSQSQGHEVENSFLGMSVEGSRGNSQLIAAIMDIVTSSCDPECDLSFRPQLPGSADIDDIAQALRILKEGSLLLKDDTRDGVSSNNGPKDRDSGVGIGLKPLGGTAILGLQSNFQEAFKEAFFAFRSKLLHNVRMWFDWKFFSSNLKASTYVFSSLTSKNQFKLEQSYSTYGLWDDLQSRDVAVPLAAWAVASWAYSSTANRAKIIELDKDGQALLSGVLAPERTVKWHGATAIHLLLENKKQPPGDAASQWSSALLDVAEESCSHRDSLLAESALLALTACVKECEAAKNIMLDRGLPIMREVAKQVESDTILQRALAEALFCITESGNRMPTEESKKWAGILLQWVCSRLSDKRTRSLGSSVLNMIIENLGRCGIPISQAWWAMLLVDLLKASQEEATRQKNVVLSKEAKARGSLQNEATHLATQVAAQLGKVVADEAAAAEASNRVSVIAESAAELPMADLLGLDIVQLTPTSESKKQLHKVSAADAALAVLKAIKAVTELSAEKDSYQKRIVQIGGLYLLRRLLLKDDYEKWASAEAEEASSNFDVSGDQVRHKKPNAKDGTHVDAPTSHLRKHAIRLLMILSGQPEAVEVILHDQSWCEWLQKCASGEIPGCRDAKIRSFAHMTLSNLSQLSTENCHTKHGLLQNSNQRYTDMIYILNLDTRTWKYWPTLSLQNSNETRQRLEDVAGGLVNGDKKEVQSQFAAEDREATAQSQRDFDKPVMDVVFVHGLCGGPFKTWRLDEEKPLTISTQLVQNSHKDSGVEGSCWPCEWLQNDLPQSRLLTVKYKTNLSQWYGATLPLEEVSSLLLEKLLAAGVGRRPVAFVTHSMGGLVVKQMLLKAARDQNQSHLVKNTSGIIFYSCPHFGSKLANMPWRMGLLLRPAPSIGELRSGSPRLEELNHFIRQLHQKGDLQVLSFCETKVTPLVEGYGGWALRMEVVPMESAYPGYGDFVVLDGMDHVSSCKPVNYTDPAYQKTVDFLRKLKYSASKTFK